MTKNCPHRDIIRCNAERKNIVESKKRSSVKSFSFVIFHVTVATLIFSAAVYAITGEWEYEYFKPLSLAFLTYLGWEIISYYWHERLWNIIPKLRRFK